MQTSIILLIDNIIVEWSGRVIVIAGSISMSEDDVKSV